MSYTQNLLALFYFEIEALDKYHKIVEEFFGDKSRFVSAQIDFAGISEDGEDITPGPDFIVDLAAEYREFKIEFPNHFRSSFLDQMCSFIESKLQRLCITHYEFANPHYNSEEMALEFLDSNNDIGGYIEYLNKKAKISFTKIETDWQFISIAYKVRNVFTHHSGIQRKIEKKQEEKKKLKGENRYYIAVDDFVTRNENLIKKHYFIEYREKSKTITDNRAYLMLLENELNQKLIDTIKSFLKNLLTDNLQLGNLPVKDRATALT